MTKARLVRDIQVSFEYPPIPDRSMDWSAVRAGYDVGDPIGRGPTPIAALADLLDQEIEREDAEQPDELVETIKEICLAGWPNAKR